MRKKARINLTIDQDVLRTAKELGLNISKVCENCLKDTIRRLTQPITATDGNGPFLSEGSFGKESSLVGRAGFEPATFCTSSRCPNRARLPALAVCLDLRLILGFSELALVGV